jgi:hypothetical protein
MGQVLKILKKFIFAQTAELGLAGTFSNRRELFHLF